MWQKEVERLLKKGIKNPYAIMSIIQDKGVHKFDRDWRKIIIKEITRIKQEEK